MEETKLSRKELEKKIHLLENELRKSMEFSQNLIDEMLDGFSVLDTHGRHVKVNPAFCRMVGFTEEKLNGTGPPHLYWPPESLNEIQNAFQLTVNGDFRDMELIFMRKNGERFPVIVSPSCLKDEKGNIINYFATVKDISYFKKTEKELVLMKKSIETSIDGVYWMDEEGNFVYTNESGCEILGYTKQELLKMNVSEVNPKVTSENWKEVWKYVKENGSFSRISIHRKKDGTLFPVEISSAYIKLGEKEYINGFAKDISKQWSAEQKLKDIALEAQRFREALDRVPAYVYIKDSESRYIYANKPTLELFGCSADELPGSPDSRFFVPDTVKHMREIDLRVLSGEMTSEEIDDPGLDGIRHVYAEVKTPVYADAQNKTIIALMGISVDITERKRIEEELKKNEEKYRLVFENAPIGILSFDSTGQVLDANKTLLEILGSPSLEATKKINVLTFPPLVAAGAIEAFNRCFETGETITGETSYQSKWGKAISVRYSVSLNKLEEGHVHSAQMLIEDITERKLSELALQESEERFRALFENSLDAVLLTIPDGTILAANPAACKMFGRTESEICQVGRNGIMDISDPQLQTALEERARTGKFSGELTFIHKNGTKFPGELSSMIFKDQEGHEKTSMLIRDITERKNAEKVIRREKEISGAIMEGAKNSHLVYLDLDFNYVRVNTAYATTCGYKPEEMIGLNHFVLFPHSENKAIFRKVRDTGEPFEVHDKPFTFPNQPERGITYWDWTLMAVKDQKGKVEGLILSLFETTNRVLTEKSITENEIKLKELNATKDKLFSIIAHDLKSPFNTLLGFSEILLENINYYDINTIESQIGLINKIAKNTYNLLQDLLLWSQSQSGQLSFDLHSFVLREVINEIVTELKEPAEAKLITINCIEQGKLVIRVDLNMFKTILRNLVSNAIKFSKPLGKIEIDAESENNNITVTVTDYGVGIDKQNISKLWDLSEHFTTVGTSGEKGTGFGLTLCKEFVEKHGGNIWVESEIGQGSKFRFTIPV